VEEAQSGDPTLEILAETNNYSIWRADELEGETTYHLELGSVTVHFFLEELLEVIGLLRDAERHVAGG
jgi:hypothetical protein